MIRRATRADAFALPELHRASILALCSGAYTSEQLAHWTAALSPALYVALTETRTAFVFEAGAALLGFAVCDPAAALLNAAYVRPSAARRGIGRQLVGAVEAALAGAGASEVQLNATLNAVAFYQSLGYARAGNAVNRLPSGIELPCTAMRKALAGAH